MRVPPTPVKVAPFLGWTLITDFHVRDAWVGYEYLALKGTTSPIPSLNR